MTKDDGLGFSDEQLAEIRRFLAKKVEEEKAKRAARDIAGSVTAADLAFGKRLQEELYRPRPPLVGKVIQMSGKQEVGRMGAPTKTQRVSKPKRPALWKRLAHRLARKSK